MAIADDFPGTGSVSSPADNWAALTPSDAANFPKRPKKVAVGAVAGSFVAVGYDDTQATFYAVAGQVLDIRPKRINSTGLTGGMTFIGLY